MFVQCLLICPIFLAVIQPAKTIDFSVRTTTLALPLQNALIDKLPSNDQKPAVEGSGVSLDDYEDEDDQLAKVTATTTLATTKRTTLVSSTKGGNATNNDELDENEFKEDFSDDLEDVAYDHELTSSDSTASSTSTTRVSITVSHLSPVRAFFSFLTRPPIAAGILVGLSIGILISVVLLICIVRRLQKREKSPSSFTAGLLYPNRYGYSKSPQEFYA